MRIAKMLRTNEQIRVSPIRLIDDLNNQIGIVPTDMFAVLLRSALT